MELTGMTMPGYRVYDYRLVLNPHEDLVQRMRDVKDDFSKQYKVEGSTGRPQLTLANFLQYEMMEERLVNRLRVIAMGYPPFKVEMKDFGSYPSHSIFINVVSKLPVQGLVKTVRKEAQRLMKMNDENKPHFIMEPHVNIARGLKPWQYEKGWLEYSRKHFAGRFIATEMILLKKPEGEMSRLQQVARFSFQNLPVSTKQGELFG